MILLPFSWQVAATSTVSTGGCDRHTKHSREEVPHVRGQRQMPGGPHVRRAVAKRSYPTSEVRGSGLDSQAATAQELPRGATLRPRTGATARRNDLHPRPGAEAGRSNPTSKEWWLCGRRRAQRSYPTLSMRFIS